MGLLVSTLAIYSWHKFRKPGAIPGRLGGELVYGRSLINWSCPFLGPICPLPAGKYPSLHTTFFLPSPYQAESNQLQPVLVRIWLQQDGTCLLCWHCWFLSSCKPALRHVWDTQEPMQGGLHQIKATLLLYISYDLIIFVVLKLLSDQVKLNHWERNWHQIPTLQSIESVIFQDRGSLLYYCHLNTPCLWNVISQLFFCFVISVHC